MVYTTCTVCKVRKETCITPSTHKKDWSYTADVQFTRVSPRLRKTFSVEKLAEIQERQWRTDYERGVLLPEVKRSPLFEEVADEWLTAASNEGRIRDVRKSEASRVKNIVEFFKGRLFSDLQFANGEAWLNTRIVKGLAVNTINRDMRPLKWIAKYAVKKGYIKNNPFEELKELKGGNIRMRWMTIEELERLVTEADKSYDFSLGNVIRVGVNTGFRKGNLIRLRAEDVNNNRITAVKTKSGNSYDVPVAPCLVALLNDLFHGSVTREGRLLNTDNLEARFKKTAILAGLYHKPGDPTNVTIHTLRHTFAALYLKRGGDIYKLSKLLGHSSVAITEKVYGHICPKDLDAQAALINTEV